MKAAPVDRGSPFVAVSAFIDALYRAGVAEVCVSPGSRSTPLAELAARHPGLRVRVVIDERSAAFFALGIGKATQRPAALICTSGTAAANYYPALIEARYGRTPLILLTADRPPEARGIGSPQTIDQIKLYADHAKSFTEMPVPSGDPGVVRYFQHVAARAAAEAMGFPPGPVHVNFPFREPLTPPAGSAGLCSGAVPPAYRLPQPPQPRPEDLEAALAAVRGRSRVVIVCGPQADPTLPAACAQLAAALDAPVLADPLSQVRSGPHDRSRVADAYDLYLRDPEWCAALAPQYVIRLGGLPTSKALNTFLSSLAIPQLVVDPTEGGDPLLAAAEVLPVDPVGFCRALSQRLAHPDETGAPPAGRPQASIENPWTNEWLRVDKAARAALTAAALEFDGLFEGRIFIELADLLPEGARLFAGNSMPVRDLDAYFAGTQKALRIMANRGANGIDGVLSTALGAACAGETPLALVVGDLSFLHDLNGLFAARYCEAPVVCVVVNNDGGGIFSHLPQATESEHFEALFGTPHGLRFDHAAALFDLPYHRPAGWDALRRALRQGLATPGVSIVEVVTERTQTAERRRKAQLRALAALHCEEDTT